LNLVDAALSSRMVMTAEERCKGTRRDGTPCRARSRADSRFCFAHDPARATQREAVQAAGLARAREIRAARRLRRFRGVGTRCPRCASRDVEWAGEPPSPSSCRVCGFRF
jgi:hypothetical protein